MTAAAPELVSIGRIAKELGLSPSRIRGLTEEGVFHAVLTTGGHRRYNLAETCAAWLRCKAARAGLLTEAGAVSIDAATGVTTHEPTLEWTQPLAGLEKDRVWTEVSPQLGLSGLPSARSVTQYVFTEMLNNAIDHSAGTRAQVRAWRSDGAIVVEVRDDGCGVFDRLFTGLGLPDHFAAIQELTKGRRTTAPDRHTGEGIFFSSKVVDLFRLAANGLVWVVDNLRHEQAVEVSSVTTGTVVRAELDPHTDRDLGAVFRRFTDGHQLTRTRPVVKLFAIGVTFVSRNEAKRLLAGMERFTEVELDFTGVEGVGQGFVDELLRVWPRHHPETTIIPTNMNAAVEFMVTRGLGPAAGKGADGTQEHAPCLRSSRR